MNTLMRAFARRLSSTAPVMIQTSRTLSVRSRQGASFKTGHLTAEQVMRKHHKDAKQAIISMSAINSKKKHSIR